LSETYFAAVLKRQPKRPALHALWLVGLVHTVLAPKPAADALSAKEEAVGVARALAQVRQAQRPTPVPTAADCPRTGHQYSYAVARGSQTNQRPFPPKFGPVVVMEDQLGTAGWGSQKS